jgi:DNA-binding NarL/FixJ family response regulator
MKDKFSSYVALTKREREIFRLIAAGYDNKEISVRLFIAEQTVKNHIREIYSKLNIHERVHVIRMARLLGIE